MTKLLLKLWLAAVVAILPATANAIEPSDLDGMIVGHTLVRDWSQYSLITDPFSGQFQVRDGQLYLVNFLGSYDVPCEIVDGNKLRIPMDGEVSYAPNADLSTSAFGYTAVFCATEYGGPVTERWNKYYGYYLLDETSGHLYIEGNIETIDSSSYRIYIDCARDGNANEWYGFAAYLFDENEDLQQCPFFNGVYMEAFKINAMSYEYVDGSIRDSYPVGVVFGVDEEDEATDIIQIRNWGNTGIGAEMAPHGSNLATFDYTWAQHAQGPVDYANQTFSIQPQGWNADVIWYNGSYSSNYDAWLVQQNLRLPVTQYYINGSTDGVVDLDAPITGKYTVDGKVSHYNYENDAWVTNDGSVRTLDGGLTIEIGPSSYTSSSEILDHLDKTVIIVDPANDVTADFNLDVRQYSAYDRDTKGEFRIQADVVPQQNCHNVESYDLYVVPKAMSSINQFADGKHDYTTGHADAVLIDSKPAAGANGENPVSFDKWYTLTGDKFNKNLNDYSLFVKANYKNTDLAPTFHQLTLLTDTVITSIGLTGADSDVTVTAANGTITVNGADNVAVYATTGAEVYNGPSGVINVAPGLYVVSAAGKTQKVIVR